MGMQFIEFRNMVILAELNKLLSKYLGGGGGGWTKTVLANKVDRVEFSEWMVVDGWICVWFRNRAFADSDLRLNVKSPFISGLFLFFLSRGFEQQVITTAKCEVNVTVLLISEVAEMITVAKALPFHYFGSRMQRC